MTTPFIYQKQSGQQVMTPQLQEAIRLLQLSYEELIPLMEQHMVENPFLSETVVEDIGTTVPESFEPVSGFDHLSAGGLKGDRDAVDDFYSNLPNPDLDLKSFVLKQFRELESDPKKQVIAKLLSEYLDENGYFGGDIPSLANEAGFSIKEVKQVLEQLKTCEPCGVFAANMEECLALQLIEEGALTPTVEKVLRFLPDLVRGFVTPKQAAKKLELPVSTVKKVLEQVRHLNPSPGSTFENNFIMSATPEVVVFYQALQKEWHVMLAPHARMSLSFNQSYYQEVRKHNLKTDERKYMNHQLAHANWVCKALQQRTKTLLDVSREIVQRQQDFFDKGVDYLKPLILKDIAEPLGVHESTVSRITTGKYMLTPVGTFELKYFFTSGFEDEQGVQLSSFSLKQAIKSLIERENPQKPLSDLVIASILETRSVPIARRTIAKYREALGIPSSFERKRAHFIKSWHLSSTKD